MNDMFVREDISKPENRINLAIFHLLMIDEFREWMFNKLNIDANSIIYPVTNSGGNRPDMIIKNGEKVIGCIEVEIGNENVSQTLAYSKCYDRVFTISGLKSHNSNLSLEEVKEFINITDKSKFNTQEILSITYLSKLIESHIHGTDINKRTQISDIVSNHPFFKKIIKELSDLISKENLKLNSGKIWLYSYGDEGFSLSVFSFLGKDKKVTLLFRNGGKDEIRFQSSLKYRKYLPYKLNIVNEWINFVENEMNCKISLIKENKNLAVPISHFDEYKFNKMIELIRKLV